MSLKELLAGRNIKCAHVVDDAFDFAPAAGLNEEAVGIVIANIQAQDYSALCGLLEIQGEDENALRVKLGEAESIIYAYQRRAELSAELSKLLFHEFEVDRQGKLEQLKPLLQVLEEAGVECCKFGADYNPRSANTPQLFFVDLKLKENSLRQAHEDAKDVLTKLRSDHPGAKPFVFLMSSQSATLGASREDFRRAACLFQSEFDDIEKSVFRDRAELERILARYTAAVDVHSSMHQTMMNVQNSVEAAARNVLDELRALDFADYFVLFKNTVSVEKIDLGSYVVELLLEYLANEVEGKDKVWDLAAELSNLEMGDLRRVRFGWSAAAMKLYSASMLHNVEMLRAEERASKGPSQGYFFTGDIYFEAKAYGEGVPERALAIISPACDLVRPDEMKGKSVVLCEGAVTPVREANPQLTAADGLPVTLMRLPKDPAQFVTIRWGKKKIHVWDDDARAAFADAEKCRFIRVGRLRPIYALQLQQKVTSDLSRVGTQKPPTALNLCGIRCFVCDGQSWVEFYVDQASDAAAWFISEEASGKKKIKVATLLLADHTVQKAYQKLKQWYTDNPAAPTREAVERVLQEDVRDLLKKASGAIPDGGEDPTIYPLQQDETVAVRKCLALVRESKSSSPYAAIKNGTAKTGKHDACVAFRLEEPMKPA